jgi:hypothetical protein
MKRRSHRQQVNRQLIHFALGPVDCGLVIQHAFAKRQVAQGISLYCEIDRLLRHARHGENAMLEFVEFLMEANACHPNLPVM